MTLTIGMASYNNYSEVWFTVQSLRLYHDLTDCEILIVDNFGDDNLQTFVNSWASKHVRYVRATEVQGTAPAKNKVFELAQSEWVLCMDSHVLPAAGSIARLKEYITAHPDCADLLQGPLLYDNLETGADSFSSTWSSGMWGQWANIHSDRTMEPYEIPMMGMGLFCCRKDAWLGFNPEFKGFGGEEGYIHEKYRKAGHKTLCLPWLQWVHHFRPNNKPMEYVALHSDKVRNYTIGFQELGLDMAPLFEHFGEVEVRKYMVDTQLELILDARPITGRSNSFLHVLKALHSRFGLSPINIIETGTIRSDTDDYKMGDGWSTATWAHWARETGSRVTTIDIDAGAIETCKRVLNNDPNVTFIVDDSVLALADYRDTVQFAYLDAGCWYGENEAAYHQMSELKAIYSRLDPKAMVLLDDTPEADWSIGRGKFVIPWLLEKGWEIIHHMDTQVLLGRKI